jgi:hypothetical protein
MKLCFVAILIAFAVSCSTPESLNETSWEISRPDGGIILIDFKQDGTISYTYPEAGMDENIYKGTWKQDGFNIYFEMNNKHAEHKGILKNDKMTGNAWNKKNETWDWKAKKKIIHNEGNPLDSLQSRSDL